jgi:hypothetical protein
MPTAGGKYVPVFDIILYFLLSVFELNNQEQHFTHRNKTPRITHPDFTKFTVFDMVSCKAG